MKQSTRINRRLRQVKNNAIQYMQLLKQKEYCEKTNDWFWGEKALIEVRAKIDWYGFDYRLTKELAKKYGMN